MELAVSVFAILMGVGMAFIWTRDILTSAEVDLSSGFFAARNLDDGSLLWLHWVAEYSCAVALIAGGAGAIIEVGWARPVLLLGVGALIYTSTNSLGWAFSRPQRRAYAIPMLIGLGGGGLSAAWLLLAV